MPPSEANPSTNQQEVEAGTAAWKTRAKKNFKEIFVQIIFVAILQTADTFSDVALASRCLINHHPKFAAMIIVPVLFNWLLTTIRWWKYEEPSNKKWSWILVCLHFYPQYRAIRLVYRILVGNKQWRKDKQFLDMITYTVEPYVESTPQIFLLTSMLNINNDMVEFESVFGRPHLFIISLTISFTSCIYGITKFLKMGVVRILPKGGRLAGFLTIEYFLLFVSCAIVLVGKLIALGVILDSVEHESFDGSFVKGIGTWFAILMLPQLLINTIILEWTLRGKFLAALGTHFPILLCPVFTVFSFGPLHWKNWRSSSTRCIAISPLITTINIFVTAAGQVGIIVALTYHVGQPAWLFPLLSVGFIAGLILVHSQHLTSFCGNLSQFGILDPNHLTQQFVMGDDGDITEFESEITENGES